MCGIRSRHSIASREDKKSLLHAKQQWLKTGCQRNVSKALGASSFRTHHYINT